MPWKQNRECGNTVKRDNNFGKSCRPQASRKRVKYFGQKSRMTFAPFDPQNIRANESAGQMLHLLPWKRLSLLSSYFSKPVKNSSQESSKTLSSSLKSRDSSLPTSPFDPQNKRQDERAKKMLRSLPWKRPLLPSFLQIIKKLLSGLLQKLSLELKTLCHPLLVYGPFFAQWLFLAESFWFHAP